MPKFTRVLLLALIAGSCFSLNASLEANTTKKVVIALPQKDAQDTILPKIFNPKEYEIIKIEEPTVTVAILSEHNLNYYINSAIEQEKIKYPGCKIYLYADNRFAYSVNYAAKNTDKIDGLILNQPTYEENEPFISRLFSYKISKDLKKLPDQKPVIIIQAPSSNKQEKLFYTFCTFSETRQGKNIFTTKVFNRTFLINEQQINNIPEILCNSYAKAQEEIEPAFSTDEINLRDRVEQQETNAWYAEWTIITSGCSLLVYLLYKIGAFNMIFGSK